MIEADKIPFCLKSLQRWVLWKTVERGGKPTKVPFQRTDFEAKSDTPATWCEFEDAMERHQAGGYDGIGFMFGSEPDGFVGVDLDGCRCPDSGVVADWAKEIILKLDSYAEVSPSKTGVKIFVRGKSPFDSGKNLKLPGDSVGGKSPGIEIYDHRRYFAVTGWRVKGPHDCQERQAQLDWLKGKFWPDATPTKGGDFYGEDSVLERARKYLAKCPPAISGQNGSGEAFSIACRLVLGFGLSRDTALVLFREWNQTCQPPWSDKEIEHKIDDAAKQPGPRNYLRNLQPAKWDAAPIVAYTQPSTNGHAKVRKTTIAAAGETFIADMERGGGQTISLGIDKLDAALGGGIEAGELVIVASRPSHGKSMLAMQFAHYWTAHEMPCVIVSEEMPAITLGKRAMQFISEQPEHEWTAATAALREELGAYAKGRETCVIIENCGSVDVVIQQLEEAIEKHKVKAALIDYVQCLKSKGRDLREQVTNTSIALREFAHSKKLPLIILCQTSREIEKRKKFNPVLSDLKESGQLEADADVVLFPVWPWMLDNKQKPSLYQIFVAKNRNRGIRNPMVLCEFEAARQTVRGAKPDNYESGFDSTEPWGQQPEF